MFRSTIRLSAALGSCMLAAGLVAVPPSSHSLSCDGIRVSVGGESLMTVNVDGVPFISSASFAAVKPKWSGTWYASNHDYRMIAGAKVSRAADGSGTMTLPMRPAAGGFEGTLKISLAPGRLLRVGVESVTTTEPAGLIEGKIGAILAGWFAGCPYTAHVDGLTTRGILPAVCPSAKLAESTLLRGFQRLEVEARGGLVIISVRGNAPVSLVDYRLNEYTELPVYWMGALERPVKAGEKVSYEVDIQFPPAPAAAGGVFESKSLPVTLPAALAPDEQPDRVIPTPKKITWGTADVELHDGIAIHGVGQATGDADALRSLQEDLAAWAKGTFGVRLVPQAPRTDESACAANAMLKAGPGIHLLLCPGSLPAEGYRITVSQSASAMVEAPTISGLLNAIRTLRQLFRERDGKVSLRACSIEDWPTFPYRGVHMFTGHKARDFQVRMMREVLGPLKINQFVYQCEYLRWDSHPELWHAQRGMEKADARAVLDEAARQHIEVTPLINTFGHSNWLYAGNAHRDLADNPDNPNTYDPTNPEAYRICGEIYDEAIRFFRPRVFHIGHDEVTMYGFPENERTKRVSVAEWLRRDITHWHDFMTSRGIRVMLWGDQFLAKDDAAGASFAPNTTESKARRDQLPKDVIIADWHYGDVPAASQVSVPLWAREGFDAVVCPWFKPGNIVRFAKAAANERAGAGKTGGPGQALGLLQTTWAGFSNDEESFMANQEQYAAYVLAAESAWTGGYDKASDVPFDYTEEFARIWQGRMLPRGRAAGWALDLGAVANLDLATSATAAWLGYDDPATLAALPVGETRMGRSTVRIAGAAGGPRALLLAGRFNPAGTPKWPSRAVLPVGRHARAVAMALGASTTAAPEPPIARALFQYADGTSASVAFRLGQNVFPVSDANASVVAPRWWESPAKSGEQPFAVHGFVWQNPYPGRELKAIEFRTENQGPALIIFGITGVEGAAVNG
jgi:hexosaminidase